jgi:type I restriction enzyme R subunit
VIQTFAEQWPSFFPNRQHVPKTLIFAKTDKHADDIVDIVREIFAGDSRFCAKITYKADDPDQLLKDFRNDASYRVAVTVDMIATGTDVKPLECVFFLRGVSSATYFEQMKGRGARTMDADDFQSVTPDARAKEKFLLVDAVGVTDSPLVDAKPLQPASERQVSLEKLLNRAGWGCFCHRRSRAIQEIRCTGRCDRSRYACVVPVCSRRQRLRSSTSAGRRDDGSCSNR